MDVFQAHLQADTLSKKLLTAHAHANSSPEPMWETHDLKLAVEAFDRLAELMPAVRARIAGLTPDIEVAA